MTWFKLSDDFGDSDRYRLAGKDGRALLLHVGLECARRDTDGRIPAIRLSEWITAAEVKRASPARLVEVGYWHDQKTLTNCSQCQADIEDLSVELASGDLYWCNWRADQLDAKGKNDPLHRKRQNRNRAFRKNREYVAKVRERDRDLCRYCGVLTVVGADHKSPTAATFDHVDPFGANTPTNVVVACRRCNGIKRDRTPTQAGMELHDPGWEAA